MKSDLVTIEKISKVLWDTRKEEFSFSKAFEYIKNKYSSLSQNRVEKELQHPLRMALYLADEGFQSGVILTALLHDLEFYFHNQLLSLEKHFGSDIADRVRELTHVNRLLYDVIQKHAPSDVLERCTQTILSLKKQTKFIFLAEQYDLLTHKNENEYESQEVEIRLSVLAPVLTQLNAVKITEAFENIRILHFFPTEYELISKRYNRLLLENEFRISKAFEAFNLAFLPSAGKYRETNLLSIYQNCISGFYISKRSISSLYRHLVQNSKDGHLNFSFLKKNTPLYDLTLVVNTQGIADRSNTMSLFYAFYEKELASFPLCLLGLYQTSFHNYFVLMCDKFTNLFRFFLQTDEEYSKYQLGFSSIQEVEKKDYTLKPVQKEPLSRVICIHVYDQSGKIYELGKGATILDFAFYVNPDFGIKFFQAILNATVLIRNPSYTLSDGDKVTFIEGTQETLSLDSFRFVKTDKAIDAIILYFKKKYGG